MFLKLLISESEMAEGLCGTWDKWKLFVRQIAHGPKTWTGQIVLTIPLSEIRRWTLNAKGPTLGR